MKKSHATHNTYRTLRFTGVTHNEAPNGDLELEMPVISIDRPELTLFNYTLFEELRGQGINVPDEVAAKTEDFFYDCLETGQMLEWLLEHQVK